MAIRNETPTIRDLVPDLLGGTGNDPLLRQDPARPQTTWIRPLHAATSVQATYVVPGDWPEKPDHWFASDAPLYPWRHANNVEYLINGEPTYEAMAEAMATASSPDHFIILLGWTLHLDFNLSKQGRRSLDSLGWLQEILKDRVKTKGVTLRVLLYDNELGDGALVPPVQSSKSWINDLDPQSPPRESKAICILDQGFRPFLGCHHQKILLVYGSEGLIGFFGGIDFHPDRVDQISDGGPLHDVHARVIGEAAQDLLVLAVNRWNFSSPRVPTFPNTGELLQIGVAPPRMFPTGRDLDDLTRLQTRAKAAMIAPPWPHHVVKIAHTVGNPELAKQQECGSWALVRQGIREAKKFIYIEDQYLWNVEAAEELGKAASRVSHITVVFPPDASTPSTSARRQMLKKMKEVAGKSADKIRIYTKREKWRQYIHAKMFVFDDEYAIIGSANCNNRGYFNDSEDNGGIADPGWEDKNGAWEGKWWTLDLNFAHKLRIDLWHEHLNLRREWLIDGVAAEVHWRFPEKSAPIAAYTVDGVPWHTFEYDSFYVLPPRLDPRP
jgi:phosphatidylserine/phosphatidylglycerophosphate/cardiolipin synthase-like enzyme